MDCTKFHELISIYIDGETSSVQGQALEKHMETCSGCKAMLNNQIKMKDMIKGAYGQTAEVDLSVSIMNKISLPAESKKPSRMRKLSVYAAAVAAACVITLTAYMSLHVDNNTVAGNEKLEEYVIEHIGSGNDDFNGQIEAVNIEK